MSTPTPTRPTPAGAAPPKTGNTAVPHEGKTAASDGDEQPGPRRTYDVLGVLPWHDPSLDTAGHDPRSAYVETFWLPVIGPSSTLLLRRLADDFDAEPEGFELDCIELSREIGLGSRLTRQSPFIRTLTRCAKFNMLQWNGDVVHVRRRLPGLGARQLRQLSDRLQALHQSWTLDSVDDGAIRRAEMVRATHLARTLFGLGEPSQAVERQLHRWHFHPSVAWHAVQWAQSDEASQLD